MSDPSSTEELKTRLSSMSDDELRNMFKNPIGKEAQKKDDGLNRPLTLDELLKSPVSNIFEVRVGQANILRSAGNENFKMGNMELAIRLYERALMHCSMNEDRMSQESLKLKQQMFFARDPIHLNLARSYLKEKRFRDSVTSAKSVLRGIGEEEVLPAPIEIELKALVILARGYIELGEYDNAESALSKAKSEFEKHKDRAAEDVAKLNAIVSVFPQLRQTIKFCIFQDRKKQRAQWRGALCSGSTPTGSTPASTDISSRNVALMGTIVAAIIVAITYAYRVYYS